MNRQRRSRRLPTWVRDDYRAWLALGPGGLPTNPLGWVITTALRLLGREPLSTGIYPSPQTALDLPDRQGPRPTIAHWPVPHRQLNQLLTTDARAASSAIADEIAAAGERRLHVATSKFERRGPAVFVTEPDHNTPWLKDARGEAGHVHASDGSLHLVLPPADARIVIERGWGERHPLCGAPIVGLPNTYLLIYAPRDEQERDIIRYLFKRAAGEHAERTGPPQPR